MSKRLSVKLLIVFGLILSVTIFNYSTEYLTDHSFSIAQIMIYRGAIALILGIIGACLKRYSLFPESWKPQIARLIFNGLASYLLVSSFTYLSASTVSLISRIDVPFLIFLSVYLGKEKSDLQFWLSVWCVLVILFLAFDAKFIDEEPIGFLFAFASVFFTSIGFILLKFSVKQENVYLLNNIFSLSNLLFGLFLAFFKNETLFINFTFLPVFILSALSQIGLYILAVKLYRWYDVEKARFPFVIASPIILILEMIIERKVFGLSQIGLSILITGMLLTIIINPSSPKMNIRNIIKNHDNWL